MRDLKKELDRTYPSHWDPREEGEDLIGIVQGYQQLPMKDGRKSWVATILDESADKLINAWLFPGSILESKFKELGIQVGERVGIRYLGLSKSGTSRYSYKNYKIVVDREMKASPPPWETMEDEAPAESPVMEMVGPSPTPTRCEQLPLWEDEADPFVLEEGARGEV